MERQPSGQGEGESESMVNEIGVERKGSLELGNGGVVLAFRLPRR